MNPHGWESFGDFAADAGLGLVLAALIVACVVLIGWLWKR